jgi:hypothetical protein
MHVFPPLTKYDFSFSNCQFRFFDFNCHSRESVVKIDLSQQLKNAKPSARPSRELSEPPIVREREISYNDFVRDGDTISPRDIGTPRGRSNEDINDAIRKFYEDKARNGAAPTIARESPMADIGLASTLLFL